MREPARAPHSHIFRCGWDRRPIPGTHMPGGGGGGGLDNAVMVLRRHARADAGARIACSGHVFDPEFAGLDSAAPTAPRTDQSMSQ